jgi:hypothetical protein
VLHPRHGALARAQNGHGQGSFSKNGRGAEGVSGRAVCPDVQVLALSNSKFRLKQILIR